MGVGAMETAGDSTISPHSSSSSSVAVGAASCLGEGLVSNALRLAHGSNGPLDGGGGGSTGDEVAEDAQGSA